MAHKLACIILTGFFLAGCSLTNREERAVTGGAVGAAGGAAVGAISGGSVLMGALVGGAEPPSALSQATTGTSIRISTGPSINIKITMTDPMELARWSQSDEDRARME